MNYSDQFEKEKKIEILALQSQNELIEKLRKKNTILKIFGQEELGQMDSIFNSNGKYLHKLESNEFEIAIVGLEKAGKSTFANALIESTVLPSAPERCTFTSTRLISGSDKAVIQFYSESEFDKIFKELLKEIEYPEFEGVTYKKLLIKDFSEYFDSLAEKNPSLYKAHVGKTDEEIKDILTCKDDLLLTGKTLEFKGDELLKDDFQSYIKGEDKGAKTARPRSDKTIEIESSKLKQLETAIIYDVPGFDSPTTLHIKQTEERLKKADAIILVTNAGSNPSLQGTTLSVINKNTDEDGIPLKDKLFVFGNQIDKANTKGEAKGNEETLIRDVEKYQIGEEKRVFVGSALKYLGEHNLCETDINYSFEVDSGVKNIRNELINYYENERFEILKRKIDANKASLESIFESRLKNSSLKISENFEDNEKARITIETQKTVEKNLDLALKKLKSQLKKEIWEGKYFSKRFTKSLENKSYFKEIDLQDFKMASLHADDSLTQDLPIEKINQQLRVDLHERFLNEFSALIHQMTDEKSKEIEVRILEAVTKSIVGSNDPSLYSEVKKLSRTFIGRLTSNVGHNEGRFTYLIERFSRDLFDILISYPICSVDRQNKFEKAYQEFMYLNNYYSNGDNTLINMILTGNRGSLQKGITTILSAAKRVLNMTHGNVEELKKLKQIIDLFSKKDGLSSFHEISKIMDGVKRSSTENDVLLEINTDIANLKDALKVAVIPAINLELAFFNGVDKQIKTLVESINTSDAELGKIFTDFISPIIVSIRKNEIDNINAERDNAELKIKLLKEMEEFKF